MKIEIPEAFEGLFRPSRYKAYYGGRGSAKSHSMAGALVLQAAQQPLRVVCGREIQKSIRDSSKRLIEDKIEAYGLSKYFDSIDSEIRGPNGSLFLFMGLRHNPDAVKSMEGIDRFWFDEASRASQRSLELIIPTVRKEGSELWFSWNPDLETDPVDVMFRGDNPPDDAVIREVNYFDNPFFPDVLRKEMEWDKRRDPEKHAHVWLGEYRANSEARVFRNWKIEEFEAPEDAVFRFGADWGFSVDPTVLVRCFIKGRTLFIDYESWEIGCEIDHTPALFDKIAGARKWAITADSARPETVSYMRRAGFRVVPAIKGPGSIEDGIEFLRSYDIIVHPRCRHVIDELRTYSYKTDDLTGNVIPVLEDKQNHTIDALRYALEALRRAPPPRKEIKSPNPPDLWGRPKGNNDSWKTV